MWITFFVWTLGKTTSNNICRQLLKQRMVSRTNCFLPWQRGTYEGSRRVRTTGLEEWGSRLMDPRQLTSQNGENTKHYIILVPYISSKTICLYQLVDGLSINSRSVLCFSQTRFCKVAGLFLDPARQWHPNARIEIPPIMAWETQACMLKIWARTHIGIIILYIYIYIYIYT